MRHIFLTLDHTDLRTEMSQLSEEGRDTTSVDAEFEALLTAEQSESAFHHRASQLLDITINLPTRNGYRFIEPSDLAGIRAARPPFTALPALMLSKEDLSDKLYGAWAGRCAGCLLGKPIEGWHRKRLWRHLKESDRWPLSDYLRRSHFSDEFVASESKVAWDSVPFADQTDSMPEDDDLNYTTTGLEIHRQYGPDFTPEQVAEFWLNNIPVLRTFTAERVAYRNLCMQIPPPASAVWRNPYREWIGAQIRADFWGYVSPGEPERAAELAWRDASVSHVKNGSYGEMWAAAMIAAAFVTSDIHEIIRAGLNQIPQKCRLADYIESVIEWYDLEVDYDTAVYRVHEMWDETTGHGWCHTISNAMVVALGLLYGEGNFEQSICRAVQPCFDTDCNGATVGSILGIIHGRQSLPAKWMDVMNDTLHTGVAGFHTVKLSDMARLTLDQVNRRSKE